MSRYQVYWLIQAQEDLAALWMSSRLRGLLTAALYQLEDDLIERAHEVGRPYPLSLLDEATTMQILERLRLLPEGLRFVEIEGIEVQFFIPPETTLAVVVRLRAAGGFA